MHLCEQHASLQMETLMEAEPPFLHITAAPCGLTPPGPSAHNPFSRAPPNPGGFPGTLDPAKGPRKKNNLEISGSEAKTKAGKMSVLPGLGGEWLSQHWAEA